MTNEDVLFGGTPHYCFFTLRSPLIAILPLSTQHRLHSSLLQLFENLLYLLFVHSVTC